MFEALKEQPADKILMLMQMYREDPREQKIDLGVGVYKNAEGVTPIMRAIKAAEQKWWGEETTKAYTGLAGDPAFSDAMIGLVLGDAVPRESVAAVATPGGTGAVRQAFELVKMVNPNVRVHVSDPTWPNHLSILKHLGIEAVPYRYFDEATCAVDFAGMMEDLEKVEAGDVVLLHGCCHNPTGANLNNEQWDQLAASLARTGALPFIDLAYLGFGDGIEPDAYGTRKILASVPEAMIAFSGSKNFGLYRERIGAAILVARDGEQADVTNSQLLNIIRGAYSQPPDHGAEIIRTILEDADLRAEWEAELAEMRNRMIVLREKLAAAIRERSNSSDFDFVADHRGMFSLLGLPVEAVDHLKAENGVYMTSDSRINVAGIPEDRVGDLADAVLAAIR